ncbi:hypothetical protein [Streptomyces silvensis]|uniref:hypothetical protein n=1 Tax=Streptomyces silvensis TaxID=1765722 RepID=UPI000B051DFC|nr:hypothetical protein [Streptomyces silvensis]
MTDTTPALEPLLARLCGGEITDKDYVGYFMNEYGEELVFAQRRGEKTARLWHSDRAGRCSSSVTTRFDSTAQWKG